MQTADEIEQEVIDAIGLQGIRENGQENLSHLFDQMISVIGEMKDANEAGDYTKLGGLYQVNYKLWSMQNLFFDEFVFRKLSEITGKTLRPRKTRD